MFFFEGCTWTVSCITATVCALYKLNIACVLKKCFYTYLWSHQDLTPPPINCCTSSKSKIQKKKNSCYNNKADHFSVKKKLKQHNDLSFNSLIFYFLKWKACCCSKQIYKLFRIIFWRNIYQSYFDWEKWHTYSKGCSKNRRVD